MPDIRLTHLSRVFGAFKAVDDITTVFPEGTVTCLLGPSGCGKTTLMRMIAGLEMPTTGSINFGQREMTHLPPGKRDVAMVFQYPVMYRTLSVIENIELPLRRDRKLSAAECRRRADEVLEVLQLTGERHKHIGDLDIGTRQKVAVGRAIARRCDVILFDEPTTNVEVHAKLALIRAFKEFRARLKQTVIYVTHDQTEAMTLADQIALMQSGRISQCAPPHVMYDKPESRFGGWFLGNPGMNFVMPRGRENGTIRFDVLPGALAFPALTLGEVSLGIRPEHVDVLAAPSEDAVPARIIRSSITIGGQNLLSLAVGETRLKAKTAPGAPPADGSTVFIRCRLEHAVFFNDGLRLPEAVRLAS
ncbi:MAG: ABC transporter ATP-binding protein [Proteobacteria bacterium]|nr:ABC transporter ATP-binding protein [Pseudomonadota bacterium]